jgi:AcrR family transcriptional regulator
MSYKREYQLILFNYMSINSQTEIAPRRLPIQLRGEKRVTELLQAAAAIFAEVGYDAATMRDIAGRAGASIGSLYQFFPNKDVIARALKTQYCEELKKLWAALVAESSKTRTSRLVDQFLNVTISAIEEHPAIIRLMDAPRSTNPAADIRESLRQQLVELFLARKPQMSPINAHRYAEITVQMVRALLWLYVDTEPTEREALVAEIKSALVSYLSPRLANSRSAHR